MLHIFCKSKISGLKVTKAELYYEGSITVDAKILDAAGILSGEKVEVLNVNNGARIETYPIRAKKGSGIVCLNGPAARSGNVGDRLIILCYGLLDEKEIKKARMKIIKVDERNRIKNTYIRR
ncbi:MAG: aspartate 1-decarboxylase [Candidatus Omnitrophica bacterium]|nr:aspartate 1-decarboxylase [Candidatus Omnitrophota bacterium]MDD5352116.1 aspartate 1-decarboxylase [Candidatus Omnitrophota bacterium]MDD5549714.1 aspartate 1-decarboxylase [Candidatus Omnitrophota bacterium]